MSAERIRFIQPGEGVPQPGQCSVCGKPYNQQIKWVVFGVKVKFYGQFILCGDCLNSLLTIPDLDFIPRSELDQAKQEVAAYRERVDPTLELVRNLRSDVVTLLDSKLGGVYGYSKHEGREGASASAADGQPNAKEQTGFFDEQLAESEPAAD